MTSRKTDSLAVPSDPLAALRALQDLDARPAAPPPPDHATAPPPTHTTSSAVAPAGGSPVGSATDQVGSATGNADASAAANARGSEPARPRASADGSATSHAGSARGRATANATLPGGDDGDVTAFRPPRPRKPDPEWGPTNPADPMAEAVRSMLSRPYAAAPEEGPFTVSTVKIPAEVWDRLGWLSKWTGRAKQDIIADALKDHFAKVVKGR